MEVYQLSKAWPAEERYSLTDQIRRSSRSVCANIAEAWRKRRYIKSFCSKLSDADAESAETGVWLDFAVTLKVIDRETHARLVDEYEHVNAQLTRMLNDAESWCKPKQ